jgi:hypothetical protein
MEKSYSRNDLQRITCLKDKELGSVLKAFIESGLLLENSKLGSISINESFESKRLKIKMPNTGGSGDIKVDAKEDKKQIDEDRAFYLQATIVRIMKTRKSITHSGIVEEVIKSTKQRFHPSITSIKKCIEGLIEKGYMKRSDTDSNSYLYLS